MSDSTRWEGDATSCVLRLLVVSKPFGNARFRLPKRMPQKTIDITDISFNRVTELFLLELRKGNAPAVKDFARAFPHLEHQILSELPTVAMLEKSMVTEKQPNRKLLKPKSQLGGCVIEAEIGRGAMGVVYRAYQTDLKRRVAIKVLDLHGSHSSDIVKRFELEREAMARLEHPNIVPVYSYGHDDQVAYLIMKCIDGHSIHDLQEGAGDYQAKVKFSELSFDWHTLARMGADVASGLHHSHEQGLIHRDIKPGNLIIDRTGKVWITDYGLAKIHDYARSLSGTGDVIGTPRYMAPEQVRGICDARSDIYSLGITLYELASNKKAWGEQKIEALLMQRATLELADLQSVNPEVPPSLAKIIMKACSFSPDDRYQTSKELQIVLERFLAGITPSDRRKRKREPDDVFRKKSRRNITIAIAGTFFIVCGTTFAYNYSRFSKPVAVVQPQIPPPEPPRTRLASANLIEKMADSKGEDLHKVVNEFFRESVKEAGEEFHLAEQEKSEILNQWEDVTRKFKQGKFDENSMKRFSEGYQGSTIPLGTKIVSFSRVIERSTLSRQEQQHAYQLLRSFAKAVVHRSIPESEATYILSELSGGQMLTSEQIQSVRIADNQIRAWMGFVQQRLQRIPPAELQNLDLTRELERTLQHAFESRSR